MYCINNGIRYRDDRGPLLPFLVGAAVAFPIGYIASNTSNNNNHNNYQYPYPYYMMPYNPYMYSMPKMMPYINYPY